MRRELRQRENAPSAQKEPLLQLQTSSELAPRVDIPDSIAEKVGLLHIIATLTSQFKTVLLSQGPPFLPHHALPVGIGGMKRLREDASEQMARGELSLQEFYNGPGIGDKDAEARKRQRMETEGGTPTGESR